MEAKFTEGEWVVDENGDVIIKGSKGMVGFPATEGTIASLNDGEYIENNIKHDAHLMATAPDMYAMINKINNMGLVDFEIFRRDTKEMRELLAKARGE